MAGLDKVPPAVGWVLDWWARHALGQRVPWAAALAIATILSVISNVLVAHTIGHDVLLARAEAKGFAISSVKTMLLAYLGRSFFALIGLLLFVALLRVALKVVGPTVSLRDTLAIIMYAACFREVVRLAIISGFAIFSYYSGSRPGSGSEMEITAGLLLDEKANPLLHHFAMAIDAPTIVFLILVVTGIVKAAHALSLEQALVAVLSSWLSYVFLGRFWYFPG